MQGKKAHDVYLDDAELTFANAVIKGSSYSQAAIDAGFSPKSVQVAAHRMMQKPKIKKYIEEQLELKKQELRKAVEVDDIYITQTFKEILNRCMQRVPVMKFDRESGEMEQERDPDTGEGIWTFDSNGAIKAAENLAKHIGYYELDNKQRSPVIQVRITRNTQNNLIVQQQQGGIDDGQRTIEADS